MNNIFKVITLNIFFAVFCVFFMIIGFVDSIMFLFLRIFKKSRNNIKSSDDAEFVIRNLANKNFWNPNCNNLVCVDSNDKETKKIINLARSDFDFLDFKLVDE